MGKISYKSIKKGLNILAFCLLGVLGVVFTILYVNTFNYGFFKEYSLFINVISVFIITLLTILTITFFSHEKEFVYKLFFCIVFLIALITVTLYVLKATGFFDKIDSVESFREYVSSFGSWTSIVFVICQFLQVVLLPIPSFITVGAGVLLFGPFIGSVLSCVGIIIGSIVAFIVGRFFGYNIVKWLIGKDTLDKWLKKMQGKDKIVLTFMFLFPFFPDDVLCFVAGITTMSSAFFIVMIIIVRIICIFASSYSLNNSLIPYDTWWGIILWILFFIGTIILTIIVYKKGESFEKMLSRKKKEKTRRNT